MSGFYNGLNKSGRGAWVVHHARKTANAVGGSAEFPALDTAGKAAALLSQLAGTDQLTISKTRLDALAKAAGLNPRLEVPPLLAMLADREIIGEG